MDESVKDRIAQFINCKGLSVRAFEISVGFSNGYMRSLRHSPKDLNLEKILAAYPEIDREWLLTGDGPVPAVIEKKKIAEEKKTPCPDNLNKDLIMENKKLFDLLERQQDQTREAMEQNKRLIGIIERMQDSIRSVEQKGDMAV